MLEKVQGELDYIKKYKTLDAYFQRFKFIRNPNDSLNLINQVDEFMASESLLQN